ncbi:MAG: hypothetical protein Ct9H300mP27_06930 [Chloroflexota bacterium]|nr:MAG: hypothetical protein Ct9H300mP27_06930 [Chloroflexota bacterium]
MVFRRLEIEQSSNTVSSHGGDVFQAIETCYDLGWTDGLPVIPPTVERVSQFLDHIKADGSEILGEIPERRRQINVEKATANAVMAGCLPEHLPIVLAATEAMLAPEFNLVGPSSSLGGSAILVIVNGPKVQELGINSRANLYGPGNRANATIGRAVRLILMNACAAIPGLFDRSVIGHPGKYTYCIAEAETETHWIPLHVERGLDPSDSAVTVFAAEGPRQVRSTGHPEAILYSIADAASSLGTSLSTSGSVGDVNIGVRQGQIAVTIAGDSGLWRDWTKKDVKEHLHARIQKSVSELKKALVLPGSLKSGDENTFVSLVPEPDDILLLFAGGEESNMSSVIPSWGPKVASTASTKKVRF